RVGSHMLGRWKTRKPGIDGMHLVVTRMSQAHQPEPGRGAHIPLRDCSTGTGAMASNPVVDTAICAILWSRKISWKTEESIRNRQNKLETASTTHLRDAQKRVIRTPAVLAVHRASPTNPLMQTQRVLPIDWLQASATNSLQY